MLITLKQTLILFFSSLPYLKSCNNPISGCIFIQGERWCPLYQGVYDTREKVGDPYIRLYLIPGRRLVPTISGCIWYQGEGWCSLYQVVSDTREKVGALISGCIWYQWEGWCSHIRLYLIPGRSLVHLYQGVSNTREKVGAPYIRVYLIPGRRLVPPISGCI